MPAQIRTLHDIVRDSETGAVTARNLVYPETIVTAVHMPDGSRTLMEEMEEIKDGSCTVSDIGTAEVTQTMTNSGMVIKQTRSGNVITEVCTYPDDTEYYTKTITLNEGGYTVATVYADNNAEPEGD